MNKKIIKYTFFFFFCKFNHCHHCSCLFFHSYKHTFFYPFYLWNFRIKKKNIKNLQIGLKSKTNDFDWEKYVFANIVLVLTRDGLNKHFNLLICGKMNNIWTNCLCMLKRILILLLIKGK